MMYFSIFLYCEIVVDTIPAFSSCLSPNVSPNRDRKLEIFLFENRILIGACCVRFVVKPFLTLFMITEDTVG